jgi:hypothetical protein
MKISLSRFLQKSLFLFFAIMLFACSPAETVLPGLGIGNKEPESASDALIMTQTDNELLASRQFSVVWTPVDEVLSIRQPAGITGTIVDSIPSQDTNVKLTGKRSLLGSSLWVEVINGEIGIGWVNSWNLTENIHPDEFCQDQKVIDLLDNFRRLVGGEDGIRLSSFISEFRGMNFRLNWYSPEIHFNKDGIDDLFTNLEEYEWGILVDSGLPVNGSFSDVIFPKLEEVISSSPEYTCNHLQFGNTNGDVIWPVELRNLNYYGAYRPAANGNDFDWRSWAIGIEFVNGEPFIAVLIHYSSEL